jgi:Ca2+-binding EF-hand superfamily protein
MIQEAKIRLQHNKQRMQLKRLLRCAAEKGELVDANDLMLACQLAKMPIDQEHLNHLGSPSAVPWKKFQAMLEYPHLHGHGAFGKLPPTRRQIIAEYSPRSVVQGARVMPSVLVNEPAKTLNDDDDFNRQVYSHWLNLKQLVMSRFKEMRRAFRLIDEDSSGTCERHELKFMLNAMFNLNIPERVFDRIIDLADFDGDGTINFAEFARLMTAQNVLKMKETLQADVSNWGEKDPESAVVDHALEDTAEELMSAGMRRKLAGAGHGEGHVKLRKTGPGIAALRKAHQIYKSEIQKRYSSATAAFQAIDEDGSGFLRRGELRKFLGGLSKSISDKTITALIDFCDSDGDAKTLDMAEFVAMLEADVLGGPDGYDPQYQKRHKLGGLMGFSHS